MEKKRRSRTELLFELNAHRQRISEIERDLAETESDESFAPVADDRFKAQIYDALSEVSPVAIALIMVDGSIALGNRRWQEIHGANRKGSNFDFHMKRISCVHPDKTPIPMEELPTVRSLRHGEIVRNQEILVRRSDGIEIPILVSSAPIHDEDGQIFASIVIFDEISEYKRIQQKFELSQKSLEQQQFLLRLSEAIRPLADAIEIQSVAIRMLGEHLKADHALYADVEPDGVHYQIRRDYHRPQSKSLVGFYTLNTSHQVFVANLHAGETLVTRNVFVELDLSEVERASYETRELTAFVTVPLVKAGRLVSFMRIQSLSPRDWTDGEVALIEEVAERTWAAVERARAEAALRQNELLLRTVIQSTTDPMFIKDREMRIVFVNEAFTRAFQIAAHDIVGKCDFELPESQAFVHASFGNDEQIMESGEAQSLEFTFPSPGGVGSFQVSKAPWRDETGNVIGIVGTATNISERKQAEQNLQNALQSMEKRTQELAAVIASIPDGLVIYDNELNAVYLNEGARQFYERYQIPYQDRFENRATKGIILAEDGRRLEKEEWALHRAFTNGETIHDFVQMSTEKDGQTFYTSVSCAPIHDEHGRITGAVATQKDITSQKRTENQLRQNEQQANTLVKQLQEADRNKNHFISMLSHELRNPLAAIVMSQDLLKHIPSDSDKAMRARAAMERQTRMLSRLVDDLLDVTRINENKLKLNLEHMELGTVIGRALTDFQAGFDEKGVALHLHLPDEPLRLDADPIRITQMIGNLLHNALKFTRAGDQVRVSLQADEKSRMAMVRVLDTGSGIEPEILQRMFDPFTQADRSLARTQGGLGLGLSIVKGIAELHGGRIEAQSEGIGKGAAFTIRLPMMLDTNKAQGK